MFLLLTLNMELPAGDKSWIKSWGDCGVHDHIKDQKDIDFVCGKSICMIFFIFRQLVLNCYLICFISVRGNPASVYLLKVNTRNTRKRCEICSKLTIKTPERRNLVRFLSLHNLVIVF